MDSSAVLATCLLREFQSAEPPPDPSELAPLLIQLLHRAHAQWPDLVLDDTRFVLHLARRLPRDQPLLEALPALATDDLYLACGCLEHDPLALRLLDQHFLQPVGAFIASVDRSPTFVDEVRQALREKLLIGTSGPPALSEYAGRGPLGGWVRVAAMRVALNLKRAARRAPSSEAELDAALDVNVGPELAHLRERYRSAFAQALREALAQLSDRERTLLRLYHAEGLGLEPLGALYRVHLSTVSRWLTAAREKVATETLRRVRERLGVGGTDAGSIAQLVLSQVDVSLLRLLGVPG
jgi:RNA polymerase sigma-70 factor (ECF subfamily)